MEDALQLEFVPVQSWTEGNTLRTKSGGSLQRWGGIGAACKILDDCDRHDVYALIEAGVVPAYKKKPWAKNSKWTIDLLAVWRFKHGQSAHRCA